MKIVITGPESTGKTTLSTALANHFGCQRVEEYARQYIDQLDRPYQATDLLAIARGQLDLEEEAIKKGGDLLVCDTDLLTIKIWSEFKYGHCDPWILDQIHQREYDWYFLCGTDVPWTFDPQREHPEQREELFAIYNQELRDFRKGFMELYGNEAKRATKAIEQIDALLAGLTYNRFF